MSKKLTKFQKEYQNECYEDLKATSSSLTKYLVTLSSTFLWVIFFSLPDFIDIFLQKEKEVLLLDLILFSSIGFFLVILISIISGFWISYNLKQGMYFYECPEQERLKKI